MGYETILNSKFTEPAAILSCRGEDVRIRAQLSMSLGTARAYSPA